jgi:hypothetical protein
VSEGVKRLVLLVVLLQKIRAEALTNLFNLEDEMRKSDTTKGLALLIMKFHGREECAGGGDVM